MTCALLERDLIPREYYEKIIWPKQWTAFSPVVAFLVELGLRVTWAPGDVCVSLLIFSEFSVNDTYLQIFVLSISRRSVLFSLIICLHLFETTE